MGEVLGRQVRVPALSCSARCIVAYVSPLHCLSRQHHQFYVDEKTKRATWNHPYDDPEYLQSLPDTHPANPNSAEAKAARAHAEELQRQHAEETKGHTGKGKETASRNFWQKMKDKAIGTKEERAEYKRQQEEAERVGGGRGGLPGYRGVKADTLGFPGTSAPSSNTWLAARPSSSSSATTRS